jgi:5'-3' exonuclease
MGIPHLNGFLKKYCASSIVDVALSALSGKKIAIDISIYLYKFTAEKNLIENMYLMLTSFSKYNITPVFIFDGKPPVEKYEVLKKRKEEKNSAESEYNRLKLEHYNMTIKRQFSTFPNDDGEIVNEDELSQQLKDIELQMDKLKPQFIYITKDIINEVKDLLRAYGATYFDSPSEADQLCAYLVIKNKAWACMSDDMDMFAYGCDYIVRNFNVHNNTATVYSLNEILQHLNLTLKEFRQICVLSGTDYGRYNSNMNLYKSLGLMKKYKQLNNDSQTFIEFVIGQQDPNNNRHNTYTGDNPEFIQEFLGKKEENSKKAEVAQKLYNMFDLDHEMHQSKLKVFENVKVVNGKIMTDQLNAVFASLLKNKEL